MIVAVLILGLCAPSGYFAGMTWAKRHHADQQDADTVFGLLGGVIPPLGALFAMILIYEDIMKEGED